MWMDGNGIVLVLDHKLDQWRVNRIIFGYGDQEFVKITTGIKVIVSYQNSKQKLFQVLLVRKKLYPRNGVLTEQFVLLE